MLGILLVVVATALGAQIEPFVATPLADAVPGTLQTLALLTGAALIGPKRGAAAAALYLAVGILGLPVFHGWASYSLFEFLEYPAAGYLIGFVPGAACTGAIAKRRTRLPRLLASMLGGHLMILLWGVPVFAAYGGWEQALSAGLLHLLPGMAMKTGLGAFIVYWARVARSTSTSAS